MCVDDHIQNAAEAAETNEDEFGEHASSTLGTVRLVGLPVSSVSTTRRRLVRSPSPPCASSRFHPRVSY